jgi:hypothetical protein
MRVSQLGCDGGSCSRLMDGRVVVGLVKVGALGSDTFVIANARASELWQELPSSSVPTNQDV